MMTWTDLKRKVVESLIHQKLSDEYKNRLLFEIKEIEKQGAERYWIDNYIIQKRWDHNKNGLVFPWLLGMTDVNPITGLNSERRVEGVSDAQPIPHKIVHQTDFP